MLGVRTNYDTTDAMFTNSLFSDYIKENGLNIWKDTSTRDIICVEFDYGSRSFDEEISHIKKIAVKNRIERHVAKSLGINEDVANDKCKNIQKLYQSVVANEDKYVKKSADEIREIFYEDGIDIQYPVFSKSKDIKEYKTIHYCMLYRSPGKAKKGSCMFIKKSLYKKARNFLWMGLKLPKKNAPIIEIGAYSSLTTSTIEDKIFIEPENILIVKDVESFFDTNIISVETDAEGHCVAIPQDNYKLKNTLFDGQALIDSSIFPTWANGYVLLRHHFTKMAAFNTHIQKFFKDYFGDRYNTATVKDMFGNEHLARNIKLITTNNAVKWLKFDVSYEYWCDKVHQNGNMFGIVKTAHESKLGSVQRTSYQMINALSVDSMENVLYTTKNYIMRLKKDDSVFLDYLRKNKNFSTDYEVLLALCEYDPEFVNCSYFRERRNSIINNYINNLKKGRTIQNADNLVIVGSPYAMLLHSVGEDVNADPTFQPEELAIQCWTSRFFDGEYLAEFRSPFNSRNNLGYLHNHHHEYFDKYFDFGKLIIAVNLVNTYFQDRNNGSDQDSDSIYTTNQKDIVEHAKYCVENYPTIVNNISQDSNHYDNTLKNFALIDNKLAAAQLDIGESSNLAQLCLSYSYNFDDSKLNDYVCILSVLAQVAIDNAKRSFDVNVADEIKRIKKDINISERKYPSFWMSIRKDFDKNNINKKLVCPMNVIHNMTVPSCRKSRPIPVNYFFEKHPSIGMSIKNVSKSVSTLIENYSLDLFKYNSDQDNVDDFLLLKLNFEDMINQIRKTVLSKKYLPLFSYLIDKAFKINPKNKEQEYKISKNKPLLLKTLYDVNPDCLLECFSKNVKKSTCSYSKMTKMP